MGSCLPFSPLTGEWPYLWLDAAYLKQLLLSPHDLSGMVPFPGGTTMTASVSGRRAMFEDLIHVFCQLGATDKAYAREMLRLCSNEAAQP
jgi:hypothetical protein